VRRACNYWGYGRSSGLHGVSMSRTAGEHPLFMIGPHSGKRLGPDRRPADEDAYGYGGKAPYPGLGIRLPAASGIKDLSRDGGCRI